MAREKSYAASHKGLRNILSKFSLLAGQINYSTMEEVAQLQQLGNEMFTLLSHHLQTENEDLLFPLEQRVKGASEHDLHDHEELEKVQSKLEERLSQLNGKQDAEEGHAFYLSFTDFQSRYLAHILEEELVTEKLLLDNFSDEELNENRARIMQKVDFNVLMLSLKYIVPAQSEAENVELLSAFRKNAPAAYDALIEMLRPEMEPSRLESLLGKI